MGRRSRWSLPPPATGWPTGRWNATRTTRRCGSGCRTRLLPWCRGCQSHHVRPGCWRAMGPIEVTVMPGKATWALAEPPSMSLADARSELVRRFLRVYAPATHTQLASWAQTGPAHAKQLFEGVRARAGGGCGRGPARVRAGRGSGPARGTTRRVGVRLLAATTPTSNSPTAGARAEHPLERLLRRGDAGRRPRRRRARRAVARLQEGRRARGGRSSGSATRSTSPRRRPRSPRCANAPPCACSEPSPGPRSYGGHVPGG